MIRAPALIGPLCFGFRWPSSTKGEYKYVSLGYKINGELGLITPLKLRRHALGGKETTWNWHRSTFSSVVKRGLDTYVHALDAANVGIGAGKKKRGVFLLRDDGWEGWTRKSLTELSSHDQELNFSLEKHLSRRHSFVLAQPD